MTSLSRCLYLPWGRLAMAMALALTLGLLAGCSSDNGSPPLAYPQTIAAARIQIWGFLKDYHVPSATVALVAGDRIVWSETIDRVGTTTPETMFGIGSVSKIFAAAAVMKLVDQGRIDLDAPLVRYLPDFEMASPEYAQITVRMLLNHSAGFGGVDFRNMFTYAPLMGYAEQVQAALATQRLKHPLGYLSVYCNDCVTLVEPLIAAVTGKPYTQYVQEELFAPLGMTHSRFALAPFPPGSFAPGYDVTGNPDAQEFGQAYASGGIYSTPSDMVRFAMMLMNGGCYGNTRLLSAAAVAEMGRDQTRQLPFNPVPTYARGLGWDNVTHSGLAAVGVRAWHKKGGTLVYESDFVVAPDEGLAVMISVSQRTMQTGLLAEQILLHALAENGRIPAVPAPLPETPLPERSPTDAELAALVGVYANKNGPIRVEAAPDRTLRVWVYDAGEWWESASSLKHRSDGTFSSDEAPNQSYRALVADGRRYLAKKEPHWSGHYLEDSLYAQAIEPATQPLSRAWQALAGNTWLAVNEDAQSWILVNGLPPRFTLDTLEDYPG